MAVSVLLSRDRVHDLASKALVRIGSRPDGLSYPGVVTAGLFAEPDDLKAGSSLLVTVATHDALFLQPYHRSGDMTLLGWSGGRLAHPAAPTSRRGLQCPR